MTVLRIALAAAVAIVGNTPSLRFANTNYLQGGYTPLGNVGVGQNAANQNLSPFASLYSDHTLGYSMR
jgi:hypothetical protein